MHDLLQIWYVDSPSLGASLQQMWLNSGRDLRVVSHSAQEAIASHHEHIERHKQCNFHTYAALCALISSLQKAEMFLTLEVYLQ